jgi:Dickkopf N-terminal cysteine-rich region
VVARAPGTVVVSQPYCQWHSDCGQGSWCRDRGDGVNVCMGHGARNASCAYGSDCGPGLFCRDRGDGMKVCM